MFNHGANFGSKIGLERTPVLEVFIGSEDELGTFRAQHGHKLLEELAAGAANGARIEAPLLLFKFGEIGLLPGRHTPLAIHGSKVKEVTKQGVNSYGLVDVVGLILTSGKGLEPVIGNGLVDLEPLDLLCVENKSLLRKSQEPATDQMLANLELPSERTIRALVDATHEDSGVQVASFSQAVIERKCAI